MEAELLEAAVQPGGVIVSQRQADIPPALMNTFSWISELAKEQGSYVVPPREELKRRVLDLFKLNQTFGVRAHIMPFEIARLELGTNEVMVMIRGDIFLLILCANDEVDSRH